MSDLTLMEQAQLLRKRGEVLEAPRRRLVLQALSARYGLSTQPDRRVQVSRAFVQLRKVQADGGGLISSLTVAARDVRLTTRKHA